MGVMQEEKPITKTFPEPRSNAPETPMQEGSSIDYVALGATLMLCVVSCVALYTGDSQPALVAVGAVAGYVTRLYK